MGRGPVGAPAIIRYVNNSLDLVTDVSGIDGSMKLITTETASSSDLVTFDSDIDSTYPIYLFKYINCHPATNNVALQVNFRDGSTAYDATKTTTLFAAAHNEADDAAEMGYASSDDIAQGTGFQGITRGTGNGNDESCSGELWLFDPSSTTFVKHFISESNNYNSNTQSNHCLVGGYCNVTAAIDGVQFKFSSGNIDTGTIKMYGIKDS
jgi:hypothetical protein